MNDCITTTKQSTTKPCAYFLGYTVVLIIVAQFHQLPNPINTNRLKQSNQLNNNNNDNGDDNNGDDDDNNDNDTTIYDMVIIIITIKIITIIVTIKSPAHVRVSVHFGYIRLSWARSN